MEPHKGQEEPGKMQQRWEVQWQQFLKTLQAPHSIWGPQMSKATPWDDANAFLASFEQVAVACQWPSREWVTRLLPALSGEAQQAFSLLAARDKEDYGKVKAAILRGEALRRERQRQQFRQFCCQELGDPQRMYRQLQELCCQWLNPERHTKEQILELLILEQFLASLPVDVQSWIQAGGPDSGAQAVALLKDFLVSQRAGDTGTWQEPLQEWAVRPLDVKEEPLDMVKGEISKEQAERFRDTQQNINREVAVTGIGITCPLLLLPPEDQDMAEAELSKALSVQVEQGRNLGKIGAPLHMVKRTPVQSCQRTTFWKVLQEDGENVDFLEGFLGPQLGLAPHPVKKEETFLPDPVESPRLPGQESDDGKRTQLKVKNSQVEGNEPVERLARTQENVPVAAEVQEEICKSNSRWGMKQLIMGCKESGELPEEHGTTCRTLSPVDTEGETLRLVEEIQPKPKLDKHHSSYIEEKNHDCPEFVLRLHSNSFSKQQKIQTAEKTYKCPDCGKGFTRKSYLLSHEMIHTGKKPHHCPECGKNFSWRSVLLRHQMIHTGKKPHKCLECGKDFSQRCHLSTHQMIHTGKKPHQCGECEKSFSRRSALLTHQMTHTGMKPHEWF